LPATRRRAERGGEGPSAPVGAPRPIPAGDDPFGVHLPTSASGPAVDPRLEGVLRQIADRIHAAAEAHERAYHQRHGSNRGRVIGAISEVAAEGREAVNDGVDQVLDLWHQVRGGGGEATPAAPRVDAHVEMPPLTIWEEPLGHLARAHAAIRRGDPAVAEHDLAALRDSCARAQARFHQYMDRVGAGADTTASALEGVVMASTMAISMLSGAAMVGASTVAVGALSGAGAMAATAVMGGARRGSEMRHGLRREMDLLGLIETAGQEGLSTMVSALLGGVASRRMFTTIGRRAAATMTAEELAQLPVAPGASLDELGRAAATRLQHVWVETRSVGLQAPVSVALRAALSDAQRPRSIGELVERVGAELAMGGGLAVIITLLLGHGRTAPRAGAPHAGAAPPPASGGHAAPAPHPAPAPGTRTAGERNAVLPPAPSAPRPPAHVMEMPAVPAHSQAGDPVPAAWLAGPVRAGGPRQPNHVQELPMALPPPRQTQHGLAPPTDVALEPTLVQPGTEPTLVQPGTEPTLVQPGTEPTLVQPGTEPSPAISPLRDTPGHRGPGEVGYLLQAYRALNSVDPAAAEQLLRGRGFDSVAELLVYEQRAAAYWSRMRAEAGTPDPSLNKPPR